jgi:hypothetical protein
MEKLEITSVTGSDVRNVEQYRMQDGNPVLYA